MGGGGEPGAEVGGAGVEAVMGSTDEAGNVGVEVFGCDIETVETGGSDRAEGFEDEEAGDTVGVVDSDLSVSTFSASPISSLNPNFNSSGTFSPA